MRRSFERELMDGTGYAREEYERTLRELGAINRLTRGYRPTIEAVARLSRRAAPGRPLRVLDIGSGYGDTLRALDGWARGAGVDVELVGVDLNPLAREAARSASPASRRIEFRTGDAFEVDGEFDVILNALFMHHLDDEQAVRCLRWMTRRARLGWFVNDLHRHPVPYHVIKLASGLAGCTRLIRHDGALSVARALTRQEWQALLARAGVEAEVRWRFPFRWGVFYSKET